MSGFDVDVARYVAKELGYNEDQIEWKESPSAQRETLIGNDQVRYIVATYSITDKRNAFFSGFDFFYFIHFVFRQQIPKIILNS